MTLLSWTRRGLMAVAGAALVAGGLSGPVAAQTPPGVLIVGQIAEPKSLDPAAVTAVNDFRILVNVYEGLTRYKSGTLEVEPALATSWDISEDGTQYTFTLRDGVNFHDGTSFNAEAVKFNFDRMLDESHPYHDTGPFPLSFFFGAVESTEVVDDMTVRFTLNAPYAPFLSNLAYPTGLIVSPAAVAANGADFGRNPVGTGPFRFAEWRSNEAVVVERNDAYWGEAAGTQAVVFRPITDANTRVAEMLAGGIDLMVEVPPTSLGQFQGDGFSVAEQAGPHVWFLILNAKEGPFADKRVRQAANYAINKVAIVNDVLEGTATVAAGPTPPAFAWAYDEALDPYPYDPDKARALIAEAGADGAELTFFVTEGGSGMLDPVPMGTAIQADLQAVGLNVKIETYEWNTFLGEVNPGLEGRADMAPSLRFAAVQHLALGISLPTSISQWVAAYLQGKLERLLGKEGKPSAAGMHRAIYGAVVRLTEMGLTAMRNESSPPLSACDAVAEALKTLEMSPSSYDTVKKIYLAMKQGRTRGPYPSQFLIRKGSVVDIS